MEVEQNIVDFMRQNLHKTRAEYYINLFKSMSQSGFEDRINKYCYLASEDQKKYFLGKLDDSSTILSITVHIMRRAIKKRKINLGNRSEINIHASSKEIMKAKEDYKEAENQINKASEDCQLVTRELCKKIEEIFSANLSFFIESGCVLKNPPRYNESGYDFAFYKQDVYVTNWHPMGGD